MKGDLLPDGHHVSRYCKASTLNNGRPTGASFKLRLGEAYVSVNWLEHLNLGDRDAELIEIRRILGTKLTLSQRSAIAILQVGEVTNHVHSSIGKEIRILHEPWHDEKIDDPSHSGIHGLPQDENMIVELIAQKVQQIYGATE